MKRRFIIVLAAAVTALAPAGVNAQAPQDSASLSLDAAIARALSQSKEVRLARSQVDLARTQVAVVRSSVLPQVNANLGYTRTFASAFDTGGGGFALPDSLRFEPDATASVEERLRYLEKHTPQAGLGGLGALFGNLPFGQKNAYSAGISGSQLLYSGGRVGAAMNIAREFHSAAELGLAEQTAEIELQVRTAYYRALLAEQFQENAREALAQAERFLEQEQLRHSAGRASELEVLRAEVARDNLRPQLVQAQNGAELAKLDLKRLADLPLGEPVKLSTALTPPPAEAGPASAAFEAEERAAVRAAEAQVAIRAQQVRIAKAAYLPTVTLQTNFGRQLFPTTISTFDGDWRNDWTASIGVQIPVFNGLRRTAEVAQAKVELNQSQLQLGQLRQAVQMQFEQARGERERARTAIDARQRTAEVAQRVYDLMVLRYERGLATQLDVSDARLSLLQARTNLAQAIADFYIADAGLTRALAAPLDFAPGTATAGTVGG